MIKLLIVVFLSMARCLNLLSEVSDTLSVVLESRLETQREISGLDLTIDHNANGYTLYLINPEKQSYTGNHYFF